MPAKKSTETLPSSSESEQSARRSRSRKSAEVSAETVEQEQIEQPAKKRSRKASSSKHDSDEEFTVAEREYVEAPKSKTGKKSSSVPDDVEIIEVVEKPKSKSRRTKAIPRDDAPTEADTPEMRHQKRRRKTISENNQITRESNNDDKIIAGDGINNITHNDNNITVSDDNNKNDIIDQSRHHNSNNDDNNNNNIDNFANDDSARGDGAKRKTSEGHPAPLGTAEEEIPPAGERQTQEQFLSGEHASGRPDAAASTDEQPPANIPPNAITIEEFKERNRAAFLQIFSSMTKAQPGLASQLTPIRTVSPDKVSPAAAVSTQWHRPLPAESAPTPDHVTTQPQAPATAPRPFVAKTLRPRLRWPRIHIHLPDRWFPQSKDDICAIGPVAPFTGDTISHADARRLSYIMSKRVVLPDCERDYAYRLIERLPQYLPVLIKRPARMRSDTRITIGVMREMMLYLNETSHPLHVASKLVGGEYFYEEEPAPQAEQPDAAATDDPVQFINTYFSTPVPELTYEHPEAYAPGQLQHEHTVNHCDRVITIIKTWCSRLPLVDQKFVRQSDNVPVALLFYRRFVECMERDFETADRHDIVLPDQRLMERYSLDMLDLFILWLTASLEIDPDVRESLIPFWTLGTIIVMSPAILMRFVATTQSERSEILFRTSSSGVLQTNDLLRIQITHSPMMPLFFECSVPEQISLQFSGIPSLSATVASYADLLYPSLADDTFLAPAQEHTFEIVRNFVSRPVINADPQLQRNNLNFVPSLPFFIEGLPGSGRTTLMKIIASRLHLPLIIVECGTVSMLAPDDFNAYFRNLFLDATLLNALVCLRNASTLFTEARYSPLLTSQLALHPVVCAFCVDLSQTITSDLDPFVTFKTKMSANLKDNAVSFWKPHLALPMADNARVDMLDLAHKLALQPYQIQKATRLAYYATPEIQQSGGPDLQDIILSNDILTKSASEQVTKNIGNLAFVSDPEVTLDDVIVSDDIMAKIKQIIGSAQNRRRVLYEWGLSRRIRRGTGVICLFDGEPGTGKTHSAEAIAKCLGLSLMRVNIASMVDKYIGETEKNLTKIFEQARPDMSLLLFDEADSLFTKRTSNVSKSNDRYSNMSVNVLLQLVERYEGVSILTTNLKNSIDPAFERRITYKIYFAMPKKEERKRLWKYMCPPDVTTSEPLDYDWLSELEMSGGEIKNAVLAGAFRAATMGRLLDTEILYDAGVTEATAAGRVMRHYDEDDDGFN